MRKSKDTTGARVALTRILVEIREAVDRITEISAPPGSKIDEIKLYLNALGSAEPLQFDVNWIFNTLNKLLGLLSNGEVRKTLSSSLDLDPLEGAIKRVYSIFYPYVSRAQTLVDVKVARLEENAAFGVGGDDGFYQKLNALLEKTGGRSDFYRSKAIKNKTKRHAFQFLDYAVKFHFPSAVIWVALQLLLAVSEPNSEARKLFAKFYNENFPGVLDTISFEQGRNIPTRFAVDDPCVKKITLGEIDTIIRQTDSLYQGEGFALIRLRARVLWQIVSYDEKLPEGATSFSHYASLGKKKGQATNRGKRAEARNLFYSVVAGGSLIQILRAMSGFVLHTKPHSDGEKIFRDFYMNACLEYFGEFFMENQEAKSRYLALKTPVKFNSDEVAHWVLFAALHSIVLLHREVFKGELLAGDAATLSDLAAGMETKKPLKSALLKLKLCIEHGADLSQLLAVAIEVDAANREHRDKDNYAEVARKVVQVFDSFSKSRGAEKEDVRESSCLSEFKHLYSPELSELILGVAQKSKKLGLALANLRVKMEFATRQEIFSTIAQLLNEFGPEIRQYSKEVYLQLFSIFSGLSHEFRIHLVGDKMSLIYVPLSFRREGESQYILESMRLNLPSNDVLGPEFSGNLLRFLNAGVLVGEVLDIRVINTASGPCINIYEGQERRTPLLSIHFEEGFVSITVGHSQSFERLKIDTQIRILRRVFEALQISVKKIIKEDDLAEREIQKIWEAADFLEGMRSAQTKETPPTKTVTLSRSSAGLSRVSVGEAIKRRTSSIGTFLISRVSGSTAARESEETVISEPNPSAETASRFTRELGVSPTFPSGIFSPLPPSLYTPPLRSSESPPLRNLDSNSEDLTSGGEVPADLPPHPLSFMSEDEVEEDSEETSSDSEGLRP